MHGATFTFHSASVTGRGSEPLVAVSSGVEDETCAHEACTNRLFSLPLWGVIRLRRRFYIAECSTKDALCQEKLQISSIVGGKRLF